jgi:hypothetical protein
MHKTGRELNDPCLYFVTLKFKSERHLSVAECTLTKNELNGKYGRYGRAA